MKTYTRKNSSYLKKAFIASNFNEMCRLCLSELDLGLTPIFQEFGKISYQELIQYSVDVLIEEGDGLPPNICEECLGMVEQSYLFKKKCKASDSKLREHLELLEQNKEEKLSESSFIDLAEDHKNLFKKEEITKTKCDESSAVDTGGTENSQTLDDTKPDEDVESDSTLVIDLKPQVQRYILKGEKRDDDQEEDLTVCEVVPLDTRNEDLEMTKTETLTPLKNVQTEQVSETSHEEKVQEIYDLWENEEVEVSKTEPEVREESVMILDVSWEDSSGTKNQNVGLEVDVEQNGVVQLRTACPNKMFDTKKTLPKTFKTDNVSFKCFACGQDFKTGAELRVHLNEFHHEVADAAFCEICGKSFVCVNNLNRHMGIHAGYKPHKCKVCGRTFSQTSILKRHLFTHETQKPFNCTKCGKGYTQKVNLLSHIKSHGYRTEEEPFQCSLCDKSFIYQSGLSRHLKVHKGIRYECKFCSKSFVDSSALAKHVKTLHSNMT